MIPAMPGTWAASWAASTARIGAVTCAPCKTNARVLVGRHRRGHGRGPAVVEPDAAERMLDGDLLNSNDLFPPRLRLSFICCSSCRCLPQSIVAAMHEALLLCSLALLRVTT